MSRGIRLHSGDGHRNAGLRRTEFGGEINTPPSISIGPTAEVLRRLELTISRRLDGLLQGDYQGLVPGHGTELGETRQYQPGDDVRRIDWNVSARMRETYIRETIADRELETWALTDLSASLGFGTVHCEKRDLAFAALSALAFITQRTGNRFGAITLEGPRFTTIPAKSGRVNTQALLHRVLLAAKTEPEGQSDIESALRRMHAVMRRRGLAVVISDFLVPGEWEKPMRALASRHEVLAIEIVDPRELELPDVGVIHLQDPETGEVLEVQTSSKVRNRFAEMATEQRAKIAASIRRSGADHLVLRTDRDWLLDLVQFVSWRRERLDSLARVRP